MEKLGGSSSFWKCLKFKLDFKNAAKNWEKAFRFWDKWIGIGIVKLSVLRTTYFSSAANVLRSSTKIKRVIRVNFSNSLSMGAINKFDKGAVTQISTVLGHVYHVACWRVFWNGTFYTFFSNFKKTKSMRVMFIFKMLRVSARFQKWSKKLRKSFCWLDNCIWIGIVKLSLLRTGYFSSAANVLTSSPKILHVNKRDFLN